ncbi:MAG: V-type ATP synthase subunit F [Desulfurococcaceae archaeon]
MVIERTKVFVIAKRDTIPFYKILGINDIIVIENKENTLNKLKELIEREDTAVVFVEESLLPENHDFSLLNRKGLYPPVVIIPDSHGNISKDPLTYYKKFAIKLLGYEVETT